MNDLPKLVDETIAALETMKRAGITHVDVSPKTLGELGRAGASSALPAPSTRESSASQEFAAIEARAKACMLCKELSRCRHNVVFGVGSRNAELMFIGEAPGRDEDLEGEPFVGRAGELLTKIIQAMGFRRGDVYIANIIKCRPPENRTPLPDEVANCLPYVISQIELIRPKVIVALGATALRALLDIQIGITKMRGHWYTFRDIPIMPTFHPAYLLRNPASKKEVWEDMQAVVKKLGRELPSR
jgi:DNA polymerase